ncbi:hypothetical protein MHF_1384 [Mycoplasma haemofelis Ohio2]|uniref:Lipoprotein n=1 Tax=Mycoplasma haemofelis (strain Ohio2) TaxID=859194 RepID=F6FGI2_MYCHI|nr:hypothetical protein MHF_1384 [Mycoplasma haemofelis Ohio2]
MNSLLIKPIMLLSGTSAAACSKVFLQDEVMSEPSYVSKVSAPRTPESISSFEDIMDLQKSKGCFFWFVESWGEKKVWNALKIKKILTQEKSQNLLQFMNGKIGDCVKGKSFNYAYYNNGWTDLKEDNNTASK